MRLIRNRRTRAMAALLAVVVAASTIGGGSAQAVSGVSPVPAGSYPFTAKIQNDLRACSAVLVEPTWVLTTASCLAEPGQQLVAGPPARRTTVTVGRTDLRTTAGHVLAVTAVIPHPTRNVALAHLEKAADGVPPIAIGGAAAQGETLLAAGFGRTATEWVPDELHAGAFTVTGVTADTLTVDGSASAASLCRGDAGGPLLRTGAGEPQLVALHDRSWQGGCLAETDTRRTATEVRVDGLAPWIAASTSTNYVALSPGASLLDTRAGTGAPAGPRGADSTTDFPALGVGGVPSTGVSAVLVDVTAVSPTANTFLTVFPQGTTRPALSSSLNASTGEIISTTQVVRPGADGRLSVHNRAGSVHIVVEVHGYFTTGAGGGLVAVPHTRVVDTRTGTGTTVGKVPTNGSRTFTFTGGVVPSGATSVFLDVAVVGSTGTGFLRAHPEGGADDTSVLDYVSGVTSQGIAVKLSSAGRATVVNKGPAVDLVISVQGYVTADLTVGADLRPTSAVHLVDTGANGGQPLPARGELFVKLTDPLGVSPEAMGGAILAVTVAGPTASGYLTVESGVGPFPADQNGPIVTSQSVANFTAGQVARTTMVMVKVDRAGQNRATGSVRILNVSGGTVRVIVTLHGWFNPPPGSSN
ncbi:trypsin-like serine protease [Micromonospora sp. WMMD1128]|uniref:trypsin-like serine protease n=1 Tax=Micromonospora sp. WMMD1128 TaxID=3015150 RepID=UPI00248B30B5|nr:trypsin-like serine protease [Micromonospora sp. WMMD1128]WBB76289.1 trypsin-like serine protease [Micromonospora sp. WMMD1128]